MDLKLADHVQDRRAERTPTIPALHVERLRTAARALKVPAGAYYTPLFDEEKRRQGYGIMRTVKGKLILTTIYPKDSTPKGTQIYVKTGEMEKEAIGSRLKARIAAAIAKENPDIVRRVVRTTSAEGRMRQAPTNLSPQRTTEALGQLLDRSLDSPSMPAAWSRGLGRFSSPFYNHVTDLRRAKYLKPETYRNAQALLSNLHPEQRAKIRHLPAVQVVRPSTIPGFRPGRIAWKGGLVDAAKDAPPNTPLWFSPRADVAAGYAKRDHGPYLRAYDLHSMPRDAIQRPTPHLAEDPNTLSPAALHRHVRSARKGIPGHSTTDASPYYERVIQRRALPPDIEGGALTTYRRTRAPEHFKHVSGPDILGGAELPPSPRRIKSGALKTELQPHQQRIVDRIQDPEQSGLVLNWGLGSGKSLGAIAAADALKTPANVVVPAALRENFRKEIAKHVVGGKLRGTSIDSLEGVARGRVPLEKDLLVVDEAHRARNPTKTQTALRGSPAAKRLILTGSLLYNHPADMAAPINLAAGKTVLPPSQADFEREYVKMVRTNPNFLARLFLGRRPETHLGPNPRTVRHLKDTLNKYVDFHPGNTGDMPTRTDQEIRVPMSGEQLKLYNTLYDAAPPWIRHAVREDLSPNKRDMSKMMAFFTGPRQAALSNYGFLDDSSKFESNKINAAFGRLQETLKANERAKAVVYSNFLGAGIEPYKRKLDEAKIPYGEFTGDMPHGRRDQLVRDYNEGKLKALLLSSAGGEGLDLKGTRLMQILEPAWNEERLKQVIGRGIRYKSHEGLPKDEQNVAVQRYISTMPEPGAFQKWWAQPDQTVDEYMQNRSREKEELNNSFRKLLPH